MRIAGKFTDKHWEKRKEALAKDNSPRQWKQVYEDFFYTRIETRYLEPIGAIARIPGEHGKGFAMVALMCTLFEFIEGCRLGLRYESAAKKTDNGYYGRNTKMTGRLLFIGFLDREPFKAAFGKIPKADFDTFYADVRCGLLHEARTCGLWTIRAKGPKGVLAEKDGNEIRLYRNELLRLLKRHLRGYRDKLCLNEGDLQKNFKWKFDHLCMQKSPLSP